MAAVDNYEVVVRPFKASDGASCARIWVSGLGQTSEQKNFIMRPIYRALFANLAAHVTSLEGDFGPDGVNIEKNYMKGDRIMFVAELRSAVAAQVPLSNDTLNSSSTDGAILGCCCVYRGTSDNVNDVAPDSETVFSVSRVSVDQTARGRKVGTKLMTSAEEWARSKGATKMHLVTGNPIASTFYQRLNYKTVGFMGMVHEKDLN
jgi:ribosomal protein S18 acetylase RimI-like enzyme